MVPAGYDVMDALAAVDLRSNATLLPLSTRLGSDGGDPESVIAVLGTVGPGDLYRIDVKKGKAIKLTKLTPSRPLFHTDGMRRYGKNFLLIEGQGRLDLMSVHGDSVSVEIEGIGTLTNPVVGS